MPMVMRSGYTLTRPSDFKSVYKIGRSVANRFVVMYSRPVEGDTRAGFVVGRAFGTAVARNRAKRLLRESFRLNRHQVSPGYHLVFIARISSKGFGLSRVESAVKDVMSRAGVLKR